MNSNNILKLRELVINKNYDKLKDALGQSNFSIEELSNVLIKAIYEDNEKMVHLLLNHGADPNCFFENENRSPIIMATDLLNLKILKILVSRGGDINQKSEEGCSLLHIAVSYEGLDAQTMNREINGEVSRYLLEQGANPFTKDDTDETPLDVAIGYDHKEAVKLLEKYMKKYKSEDE